MLQANKHPRFGIYSPSLLNPDDWSEVNAKYALKSSLPFFFNWNLVGCTLGLTKISRFATQGLLCNINNETFPSLSVAFHSLWIDLHSMWNTRDKHSTKIQIMWHLCSLPSGGPASQYQQWATQSNRLSLLQCQQTTGSDQRNWF